MNGRRQAIWVDRLTSLWSPVLGFLCAFIPYLILVGLSPGSASWAQGVLKAWGGLMVLSIVSLAILHVAAPSIQRSRKLRIEAKELLSQIDRELRRAKTDLAAGEKLKGKIEAVEQRWSDPDPSQLEKALKELSSATDQQLPGWRRRSTVDNAKGLLFTLLAVLLVRTVLAEPFKIPSGSMLPTLQIGDHVVVNRFIYGVRIPWLNKVPFVIVRPPRRGDVIVFNNPVDESKDFIKRVVGIPGDTIQIVDEVVQINGQPQPRRLVAEDEELHAQVDGRWYAERESLYEENLSGVSHAVLQARHHPHAGLTEGPFVVPEGHVFVLGDNRDNSSDSRYGFGVTGKVEYLPYGNIKGKAIVVWLSLGYGGFLGNLFGGTGLRLDRLFLPVR